MFGKIRSWWRHQMETFSALLALCGGRPVTRNFDIFFDLRLNKQFSKQSRPRWFETPLHSLWRHCNVQYHAQWLSLSTSCDYSECVYTWNTLIITCRATSLWEERPSNNEKTQTGCRPLYFLGYCLFHSAMWVIRIVIHVAFWVSMVVPDGQVLVGTRTSATAVMIWGSRRISQISRWIFFLASEYKQYEHHLSWKNQVVFKIPCKFYLIFCNCA